MWLLGSTTDGDKKGISDYFKSPLKISLMGGAGSGDATSIIKGGGTDLSRSGGQVKRGETESERSLSLQTLREQQAAAERIRLQGLRDKVEEVLANSPKLAEFKSQIRLDMTRDGLRIQIVDDQNRPMFDSGSDQVKPYMRAVLQAIGSVMSEVPNRLTLEGHTDAKPFSGGLAGYSNWELSSARANASRRELVAGGLKDERVLRVQGLAASVLYDKQDPFNPMNRRISIIVMTREAEDRVFNTTDAVDGGTAPALPTDEPGTSSSTPPTR
jgi:chemotaxis protein MotB